MNKLGRNDACHCGSGLKYKKCCLAKEERQATPSPQQESFITNEVKRLQEQAKAKAPGFKLFGTLFFFSTASGDAWLLELTENDAVKVAQEGKEIQTVIEESDDYLEIGWTHTFDVTGGNFIAKSISDNSFEETATAPITIIKDTQRKFKRKFSSHELEQLHTKAENKPLE